MKNCFRYKTLSEAILIHSHKNSSSQKVVSVLPCSTNEGDSREHCNDLSRDWVKQDCRRKLMRRSKCRAIGGDINITGSVIWINVSIKMHSERIS